MDVDFFLPSQSDYEKYGLDDFPDFGCLCELCDCGCFELSRQPHSLNCKQIFNHNNRNIYTGLKSHEFKNQKRSNSNINISDRSNVLAFSSLENQNPKIKQSEYQSSFINNNSETKQTTKIKIKDNLSLFTDNGRPNEFYSDLNNSSFNLNQSNRTPLRSKTLNRLNNMIPNVDLNNNGISWYQTDYNFFGSEEQNNDSKLNYNSLNHYKNEYIRNFDEHNKGLVDNYSITKGSPPLVSSSIEYSRSFQINQDTVANNVLKPTTRAHDFRPVWVPKKYDGRNMFVSHIDSALFPDKERKEYETQYNNNYDSNPERRVLFDRESYVGKFPSYKYLQNYENKLVPTIKPKMRDSSEYIKYKLNNSNEPPSKSIYQADFDPPASVNKKKICKAALLQSIMRKETFSKNKPTELKSILQKRTKDIETYNIF